MCPTQSNAKAAAVTKMTVSMAFCSSNSMFPTSLSFCAECVVVNMRLHAGDAWAVRASARRFLLLERAKKKSGMMRKLKVNVLNVLLGDYKWKPAFVGGRRCVNWNWSIASQLHHRLRELTRRVGGLRSRFAG